MSTVSNTLKGKKYFLEGNLPASVESFTMALEEGSRSPDIFLGRGAAYLKLGQFDKAIDDLSEAVDRDGDLERAYFLRGIGYLNTGEFEHALSDLNRTLEYNSERGAAIVARGLARSNLGQHSEAKKDLANPYVLETIVIDEFLEEYALSEALFKQATTLFSEDTGQWRLLLTADEMAKIENAHY